MRKLIAVLNMTLDGICDHTAGGGGDEMLEHYTELLNNSGAILYGRITYGLMEYWRTFIETPSGNKAVDDFAVAMNTIPKIVFSHTLNDVDWETATLAPRSVKEEVLALKQQSGKDILVGSPSMIVACLNLNLVDEYQLCILPVIAGKGLPLFKNVDDSVNLKLLKTKTFNSGVVTFYYEPVKNDS